MSARSSPLHQARWFVAKNVPEQRYHVQDKSHSVSSLHRATQSLILANTPSVLRGVALRLLSSPPPPRAGPEPQRSVAASSRDCMNRLRRPRH